MNHIGASIVKDAYDSYRLQATSLKKLSLTFQTYAPQNVGLSGLVSMTYNYHR